MSKRQYGQKRFQLIPGDLDGDARPIWHMEKHEDSLPDENAPAKGGQTQSLMKAALESSKRTMRE